MHPDCDLAFALASFECTMLERPFIASLHALLEGWLGVARLKEFSKILCKFHVVVDLPH